MTLVWMKVLLAPLTVAAVALAARVYGPRVAGVLMGLPLTSGPLSACLASEQGAEFASRAARGAVTGTVGLAAFCAAYAWIAAGGAWTTALLGATLAFGGAVLAMQSVGLGLGASAALAAATLVVLAEVTAGPRARGDARPPAARPDASAWDLPARMLVVTVVVGTVTASARWLGPAASGALSTFPVVTSVLTVAAQRRAGPAAAVATLSGALAGAVAGVAFFTVVAATVTRASPSSAYAMATAAALSASLVTALGIPRARAAQRASSARKMPELTEPSRCA